MNELGAAHREGRRPFKVYVGHAGIIPGRVTVRAGDGPDKPLAHHARHSPDGFAWGYHGSGAGELARCILLDHFDYGPHDLEQDLALPVPYMDFKDDVIAHFPAGAGWRLTTDELDLWVDDQVWTCPHCGRPDQARGYDGHVVCEPCIFRSFAESG